MTDAPETHYARSADGTNLAYQLSGNGPLNRSGIEFLDRGERELKGVPGPWRLYAVVATQRPSP